MRKPLSIALALLSTLAMGANSILVKDNSDIALTLSQGNYNGSVAKIYLDQERNYFGRDYAASP